ncbi:unnamed protein product [Parascedosporium putredinis]|uniref:Piwi domain-containing protein n=1 Tax=Parascedosporium putredinis TaxID=1442378 RepID=A0A9P1HCM4_9PEZI|nr:unnamed protein product [Parascedosporium putredinis]CAI8003992.1 unnamed protein product [Parascedosporium putredinis]
MVLGVDVSHASPGVESPSMASMVMSIDQNACRYAAAVETNGYKVEMLTRANINKFLDRLLPAFRKGTTIHQPQHVYYFRDGVSEGQFAQVIEYEVNEMKERLRVDGVVPKFTVIVATKRHHIRFFPDRSCADKNGNPLPGTLVERDVTHPFHWDFYLCSHLAIQGTARPVHYHVILDEANCQPNELQRMIYEQCYMYARSTTAVSLHPAVYYAHLASSRARAHDSVPQGGSDDAGYGSRALAGSGDVRDSAPLRPMGAEEDAHRDNIVFFPGTMWYI